MDRLSADEIQALVQAGESQTVELKPESESQGDIGELLVALANTDGGTILFGVADTKEIVGITRLETLYNRVQAAARACRPPLNLYLTLYTVEVKGRQVVIAQLPAGGSDLYSYAGVYRRRQGSRNLLLMAEEMKHLIRTRMSEDFDSQPLRLGLEVLDPAQVQQMLALRIELMQMRGQSDQAAPAPYPHPTALEQLVAMRALAVTDGQHQPTIAGLLMLGRQPEATLPQATIRIAAFNDEHASAFVDRAEIGGPLPQQLERTLAFIGRNTRLGATITGATRTEHPQYPMVAVREAVVNALLHRSYSSPHPIMIHLFPSRLEVLSPGGLLPGLQAQALEGKHVLRNHTLGPLAYFARLAETWGTGIRRMRGALIEAGLPPPEFRDEDAWLRLTFYNSEAEPVMVRPPQHLIVQHQRAARLTGVISRGLNTRQRDLVTEWEEVGQGQIRRAEYERRYDIAVSTAAKDLHQLVAWGVVRTVGKGPQTLYVYVASETAPPGSDQAGEVADAEDRR